MDSITISTNVRHTNTSEMTFFLSGRQRIGAHALFVQHTPTAAAILTSFLLSCESKGLKKSRNDWLNSGNAMI